MTSIQIVPSSNGSQDTLTGSETGALVQQRRDRALLQLVPIRIRYDIHFESQRLGLPALPGVLQVPLFITPLDHGPASSGSGTAGEAFFQELGTSR